MLKKRMENDRFRHELKYLCSNGEVEIIKHRIENVIAADPHTDSNGSYLIRSVYFDNYSNISFYDNENGVDPRLKWRIRTYDLNRKRISLECKIKENGMTQKKSCFLSEEMFHSIISGGKVFPDESKPPLLNKFLIQRIVDSLSPVVIVQYRRYPFVYSNGNVRITFDCNICSGNDFSRFFDNDLPVRMVLPTGMQLMEVKYDEFLPDFIFHSIQLADMKQTTFSKFYLCRKYGYGGTYDNIFRHF